MAVEASGSYDLDMLRKFAILTVLILAAGCDKPCHMPAGTYEITYKKLEGDCPDELVAQFDGKKSDLTIEAGECRRFATQHTAGLPNGCDLTTDMSAELAADGVHDGEAVVSLHCTEPKPYTCRELFSVEYRRKP